MSAMIIATLAAAHDTGRVVGDVGQRHRQRRLTALQHHTERVADQQHIYVGSVAELREARVVTREHGDFFAVGTHFGEVDVRAPARRDMGGHGFTLPG
jgi:hypothetical protein